MALFGIFGKKKDATIETQEVVDTSYDALVGYINDAVDKQATRKLTYSYDEIYQRRQEDNKFLEAIVKGFNGSKYQKQNFESTVNPKFLVKEVREVLQKTLYNDFLDYNIKTQSVNPERDLSWEETNKALDSMRTFARSLRKGFDFYLDICRNEKSKFSGFNYGVLPVAIGSYNPRDPLTFNLMANQELGENINYDLLQKFGEHSENLGISFNPTIEKAFDFLDTCVQGLVFKLDIMLKKSPGLLKAYKFAKSDGYQGVELIKNMLDTTKQNGPSATFYLSELAEQMRPKREKPTKEEKRSGEKGKIIVDTNNQTTMEIDPNFQGPRFKAYKQARNESGLDKVFPPKGFICPIEINEMANKLHYIKKEQEALERAPAIDPSRLNKKTKWFLNPHNDPNEQ